MSPQFDPSIDHYATLGVAPDATADQIKRAYRRLAMQYHPDSTGGDKAKEARFKEIGRAYEVLGDNKKRAQYDAMRSGASRFGGGSGAGFGGAWDIGDLFSQFFANGPPGSRASGGRPGRGGFRVHTGPGSFGDFDIFTTGTGGRAGRPGDPQSRGQAGKRAGKRPAARPTLRTVPASDGTPLTQRGKDIYSDLRVQIDEAMLGKVADVPTLTGVARVKVPPGTSSGVKLRLKGKGVRAGDGEFGDHFVTIQIDVPQKLDDKSRELLAKLMKRVRGKRRED